ncbi:hypothetical protein [Salinispora arenicola]|uniref:hypothetical protein n=1 Tax=Salinispora arenicola TaxID=168697 RepID=UPI0016B80547|nr:hypothetical protein [Salinispora arenicola]NIL64825.1 hypothetical protein [Salinispora arenicola]
MTAPVNLDAWAAGPGTRASEDDITWLFDVLTGLANDPRTQMWALANSLDNFTHPFANMLANTFMDAFEERIDLLRWAYFGDKQDHAALQEAAAEAVHAAVRSAARVQAIAASGLRRNRRQPSQPACRTESRTSIPSTPQSLNTVRARRVPTRQNLQAAMTSISGSSRSGIARSH